MPYDGPGTWRSIRNYADGIALAGAGRFASTMHRAPGAARRLPIPRSGEQLSRELSNPDVVHLAHQCLGPFRAAGGTIPTTATLHDFIPQLFAKENGFRYRLWARRTGNLHNSLGSLPLLFANSECTRRDSFERIDLRPEQVLTIPVSIDLPFFGPAPEIEFPGLPEGPSILSVGAVAPHKHLPLLLACLAEPCLEAASLVRVGEPLTHRQRRFAGDLGVADRVLELGPIGPDELLAVMARATVLAQPSLYEGFGMPVAEAMAFGLPAVCSDGGALAEVAGDGALVVPLEQKAPGALNTDDVRRFASALASMVEDPALRAGLRSRGKVSAQRFHPETVGPLLAAGYAEVIERWGER